jgi:hypothetical protein
MTYPYPFDQPNWTVADQHYACTLVNKYRMSITRVNEIYRPIIEEGRCLTFEEEYAAYQASLTAQPLSEPTEEV